MKHLLCIVLAVASCLSAVAKPSAKEIVAATLIAEAGGERAEGAMEAVYEVIYNRSIARGMSEVAVVLQPKQFSCWNNKDVRAMVAKAKKHPKFTKALTIASAPPTNYVSGATHYHATSVKPKWSSKLNRIRQIGAHIFYT